MAMDRIAFYLPFINKPVYWYGIFVTLGILLAFGLYMLISYKKGIDIDFSLELFIWVVPLAVIFCRVFYVVPRIGTEYHLDSWEGFVDAINVSNGGLTIIGGIFGGALGIFFCCLRNRKYTLAQVADCVVIALLLGQIIGRWGNFFNQELYGIEVTQDWMKHFPLAVYIEATGTWHYASFFYEGVLNAIGLAIALVIFFVPKKPVKTGTIMIFYLGWYGLVRGTLEFIKGTDPITIGGTKIKVVQLICYLMLIVAIVLQILLQKGVIRFETKWFKKLCDKKREKDLALAAEKAAKEGGESQNGEYSETKVSENMLADALAKEELLSEEKTADYRPEDDVISDFETNKASQNEEEQKVVNVEKEETENDGTIVAEDNYTSGNTPVQPTVETVSEDKNSSLTSNDTTDEVTEKPVEKKQTKISSKSTTKKSTAATSSSKKPASKTSASKTTAAKKTTKTSTSKTNGTKSASSSKKTASSNAAKKSTTPKKTATKVETSSDSPAAVSEVRANEENK